ncbi:hypothetical protein M3J09_002288 [Ascochyta lentis]
MEPKRIDRNHPSCTGSLEHYQLLHRTTMLHTIPSTRRSVDLREYTKRQKEHERQDDAQPATKVVQICSSEAPAR